MRLPKSGAINGLVCREFEHEREAMRMFRHIKRPAYSAGRISLKTSRILRPGLAHAGGSAVALGEARNEGWLNGGD